jgi:hypothetical protein
MALLEVALITCHKGLFVLEGDFLHTVNQQARRALDCQDHEWATRNSFATYGITAAVLNMPPAGHLINLAEVAGVSDGHSSKVSARP